MKETIDQIHLHRIKMTLKNPFQTSFGVVKYKHFYLIEVIDHKGNIGYGETVAFFTPWYTEETTKTNHHLLKDFLIPLLQRENYDHPREISRVFSKIKGHSMAKAAIESAIWDLYAKQQNVPLGKLLGGTKKVIDVGISLGIEKKSEKLFDKIEQAKRTGYKRFKLKIKPGYDYEILQEVRHYFPDLPLMVDANGSYSIEDIEILKKLDDFHLLMIEQPFPDDAFIDHAKLQQEIKTPICLDESIHSFEDARLSLHLGSCRIINIKFGRVGGLQEALRIHDFCKKSNVPVWCGGMLEAGIGRAHNIALASLPQFTIPGDIGPSHHYWEKDIIESPITIDQGQIYLKDLPGIGVHIKRDDLKKHLLKTETYLF